MYAVSEGVLVTHNQNICPDDVHGSNFFSINITHFWICMAFSSDTLNSKADLDIV